MRDGRIASAPQMASAALAGPLVEFGGRAGEAAALGAECSSVLWSIWL
ncbi:hypothetical protein [Sphingorhabdus lutea]